MPPQLDGVKVAVIVHDGFEQVELDKPVQALREAGATVDILAPDEKHLDHIKGLNHADPAPGTSADRLVTEASANDYDALFVPGGAISPDAMRASKPHLDLTRQFADMDKPVFAICHGPWVLAEAGVARGRRMTSWENIAPDLERAGAEWVNEPVVVDANIVTSRKPADIPKFNEAMIEKLQAGAKEKGRATGRTAA